MQSTNVNGNGNFIININLGPNDPKNDEPPSNKRKKDCKFFKAIDFITSEKFLELLLFVGKIILLIIALE